MLSPCTFHHFYMQKCIFNSYSPSQDATLSLFYTSPSRFSARCTFLLTGPWLNFSITFLISLCQWHICHLYLWGFSVAQMIFYAFVACILFFDLLKYFLVVRHEYFWQFQMNSFADFSILNFLALMLVVFLSFIFYYIPWIPWDPFQVLSVSYPHYIALPLLLGQTPFQNTAQLFIQNWSAGGLELFRQWERSFSESQ